MPTLEQSFIDHDLGFLRIIADLWRVDVPLPDVRSGRKTIIKAIKKPSLIAEIFQSLPTEAQAALQEIIAADNRIPLMQFTRQNGEIRAIGPAKRDREKPYLNPISIAEILYYRGLIGRAYFDLGQGTQEYIYIPDDFLPHIPQTPPPSPLDFGRPATPAEYKHLHPANDRILDHSCSLLAALRIELTEDEINAISVDWPYTPAVLIKLLQSANLLGKNNQPQAKAIKIFLEAPREEALLILIKGWLQGDFNDLKTIPHLKAEGTWKNDAFQTRQTILSLLNQLDLTQWQSLGAWIEHIHQTQPDLQRSGGEYDAWYIRDQRTGEYLKGETRWLDIEGALLRFIVTGPLHWLGITELGAPAEQSPPIAFRYTPQAAQRLNLTASKKPEPKTENVLVNSRLEITCPPLTPRSVRYQIARFTEWDGLRHDGYRYRITPTGLKRAEAQGLKIKQLASLLTKHSNPTPPNLQQTLNRWSQHGTQARIEPLMILRVTHPDIIVQLKASRAARFLGDPLGPTTIVIQPGSWDNIQQALAELGVLAEVAEKPSINPINKKEA